VESVWNQWRFYIYTKGSGEGYNFTITLILTLVIHVIQFILIEWMSSSFNLSAYTWHACIETSETMSNVISHSRRSLPRKHVKCHISHSQSTSLVVWPLVFYDIIQFTSPPPPLLQIGVLASVCAPSAGKNIVYSYTPTHTHTPTHTPTNIHTATPTSIASLLQTDGKYRSTIVRTPCPPDRRIGVPCPVTPPRTCVPCPTNRRSGGGGVGLTYRSTIPHKGFNTENVQIFTVQ